MTRRTFCAAPAMLQGLSRSTPNLLLIMSDQHRADCVTPALTPALDRLSREGVRFQNAYSSTPTCTPARAALLTGMSPWRHGMLGYSRVAPAYPVELPRRLRDAGYHTFGIGKMHWTPQRNLHGFHGTLLDESGRVESPDFRSDYHSWFASQAPNLDPDATGIGWNGYTAKPYQLPERLHPTRWTADCAVNFLESYQRAEPFFLKVSFARPHSPYDPPTRWWDRYANEAVPKPAIGEWAANYREKSSARDDAWHGDMGAEAMRRARVGYWGSVSFVDEQIGRVIEALDKRHWLDNTLIVFLSDHGDMNGDHWLWRKSYAYEASARIPLIARGPGAARNAIGTTPVEIRDILPTLLTAAGVSVPEACDGQNLFTARREWIDLEHDVCYDKVNHWTGLTNGSEKYIFHAYDASEQLFNLQQDPHELHDLAGVPQAAPRLALWRSRMVAHLEPRGEQWVTGGELRARPQSMLLSPNYPAPG